MAEKGGNSSVYRQCACMDCGKIVRMHIKSKRCPDCQRLANQAADRASKRRAYRGEARSLGSTDSCARCGQPYTVTCGRQRYCPDCAQSAWRENDRKASRDLARERLQDPAYRAEHYARRRKIGWNSPRACAICGKEYIPNQSRSMTCGGACAKALRAQKDKAYRAEHAEELKAKRRERLAKKQTEE